MSKNKRTNVIFSPSMKYALEVAQREKGLTQSHIIRKAVAEWLQANTGLTVEPFIEWGGDRNGAGDAAN